MLKEAWVYLMASRGRCLYIGVTRDLRRRWQEHRLGEGSTFASKYRINRLVHVERFGRLLDAVQREKQLKGWRRSKKITLIETQNPTWEDLGEQWGWKVARPPIEASNQQVPPPSPSLRSGSGSG